MSGLFGWISGAMSGVLSWFGFYQKNASIMFLGLDNAGKTTLMSLLAYNKLEQHRPTLHAGCEELAIENVKIRAHDLGGHEAARKVWASFFPAIDAVVFLIDCADRERFPEAKKELDTLLAHEGLKDAPFLILGNKIDSPIAASEHEIRSIFGLTETTGKSGGALGKDSGVRPIELFMCSLIRKAGYGDGLKWLTNYL